MTDDLHRGTMVNDRFELREPVDTGGLATVWRAMDVETKTPVAVKCERDERHDPEQVRAHFLAELRWFRRLTAGPTPGSLVYFVEGSVSNGTYYLVTEFVDGGSVADAIPDPVAPSHTAFEELGWPICRAVEFLHRNDICHLDVKPGNVLRRTDGSPALIDLNSAVSAEEGTKTLFHHDPYKAPEVTPTDARERPVGPWTDVYALGVYLTYLYTGEAPTFEADDPAAWEPVDPTTYGADCPDELAAILRRATAPDPDDRFPHAGAFNAAIYDRSTGDHQSLLLTDEATGQRIRVSSGATLGRWAEDGPIPSVVLPDPDRYLSGIHGAVGYADGHWRYVDRSVNGTYVHTAGDWRYVASADGVATRRAARESLPTPDPPESVALSNGDRLSPVSPEYGCTLRVRTE